MKLIALNGKNSVGKYLICDDEWFEELSKYHWYNNGRGYARAHIPGSGRSSTTGKYIYAHSLVANSKSSYDVDHIKGNLLDVRLSQLRIGTHQENCFNQKKRAGSSKFKGVYLKKTGKWIAQLTHNYKNIYLGSFFSEDEAARAYDAKASKMFGEFARLNFNQ